ncbi:HIT domain-containing protein [Micromonospora sp. NPDC049645]|uniref:HIT family protein n=1 Tax=Micromonospora sp. NPDC049645 TaxID=3155508 RepID=UPI00343707ED
MVDVGTMECPFCVEFEDVEKSEFRRLFPRDVLPSRVLEQDSDFVLIAGIGAFRPGYLLLIPRSHVKRFGDLSRAVARRAEAWRLSCLRNLRGRFGEVVMFEHGGTRTDAAGGCIDHAHLHLVPCRVDLMSELDRRMPFTSAGDLSELPATVRDRPYLLVQQGADMRAYFPQERLPSQYMRRLIMQLEGTPDNWDWAVFAGKENVMATVRIPLSDAPGAWLPNA